MANRITAARDALKSSKNFLGHVAEDIRQEKSYRRKFGAGVLALSIVAHTMGGLSSLYFWAASKSYAESGHNIAAPGATLFALSLSIERYMGHSAANHFTRFRTVLGKMQEKKQGYKEEHENKTPLKLRQKVGHGMARVGLAVTLGAVGAVARAIFGNPEASTKELKKHSTRAALRLAVFNGGLGLAGGGAMNYAEGRNPHVAEKALDVAQGHWPTLVFVGLAVTSALLSRQGEPASIEAAAPTNELSDQRKDEDDR